MVRVPHRNRFEITDEHLPWETDGDPWEIDHRETETEPWGTDGDPWESDPGLREESDPWESAEAPVALDERSVGADASPRNEHGHEELDADWEPDAWPDESGRASAPESSRWRSVRPVRAVAALAVVVVGAGLFTAASRHGTPASTGDVAATRAPHPPNVIAGAPNAAKTSHAHTAAKSGPTHGHTKALSRRHVRASHAKRASAHRGGTSVARTAVSTPVPSAPAPTPTTSVSAPISQTSVTASKANHHASSGGAASEFGFER